MASGDNDEMGFQHRRETLTNFPSLQRSTNGGDPFFGSTGWDPVVSLSQSQTFGSSSMVSQTEVSNSHYPVIMEHQGINGTSQYSQYPSSSDFVELVPKLPCFGSGNFTEMVASFGLPQCSQITSTGCTISYAPNQEGCNERTSANGAESDGQWQASEDRGTGSSLGERRKRMSESIYSIGSCKNAKEEFQKDTSRDSSDVPRGQDEKRLKKEENVSPNSRGKQVAKLGKETSQGVEAPEENYIHVRARRGQATNSHSLAERVRREKISERMRLLQELVPGCNKITGKAVMLDEIINYVQSLQQQVEFLSMKLATVNPELNIDIERLLSKDILHPPGGNAAILGLGTMINSSHPFPSGVFLPASLPNMPSSNAHFPPFPQNAANNEFQSLFQMGYDSTSDVNSLGPNSNGDDPLPGWLNQCSSFPFSA